MTAVLDKVRQLELEYKRGSLTREEFERTREYLLASVEDAELVEPARPVAKASAPTESAETGMEIWHVCIFLVLGAILSTTLGTVLFGDLTLALTLTVTLLAAIAVRALQKADD